MTPDEINVIAHKIATLAAWHACAGWKGDELAKFELLALQYRDAMEEQQHPELAAIRKGQQ